MTIHVKNNAVGLDEEINKVILSLDDELNTKLGWGVDIYHKIYKNQPDRRSKPNPFAFLSDVDYQPVFVNDTVSGEVGFVVDDKRKLNISSNEVDVYVIFSLNIDRLDNGSLQREDELVIKQAKKALWEYDPTLLLTGIKNVYDGFNTDNIIYSDMNPFINFSFKISLFYIDNNC